IWAITHPTHGLEVHVLYETAHRLFRLSGGHLLISGTPLRNSLLSVYPDQIIRRSSSIFLASPKAIMAYTSLHNLEATYRNRSSYFGLAQSPSRIHCILDICQKNFGSKNQWQNLLEGFLFVRIKV